MVKAQIFCILILIAFSSSQFCPPESSCPQNIPNMNQQNCSCYCRVSLCRNDQYFNNNNCSCACNKVGVCVDPYVWDYISCQCQCKAQAICQDGFLWNQPSCGCFPCVQQKRCLPNVQLWSPKTCSCECVSPK